MSKANSKPFWRSSKECYYCWINGHQRSLGKKKNLAWAKYRALLEDRDREREADAHWTVRRCFDYYLEFAAGLKPNTFRNREQTFNKFCTESALGGRPHTELTVDHLEVWVRSHPQWSLSTRRSQINTIMAAINHCVWRGKIPANPIRGLEKPRWERRKEAISVEDLRKIHDSAVGPFRAILTALWDTGARPSELCRARIEHYRDGKIILEEHKEEESGEDRVIYLPASLRADVEARIGTRTEGPIWQNARGEPWTPDTLYCRFKRLGKKLGLTEGVFPYATRSRFITDGIESGIDVVTMGGLVGHRDIQTTKKYYVRFSDDHFRRALAKMDPSTPEDPGNVDPES